MSDADKHIRVCLESIMEAIEATSAAIPLGLCPAPSVTAVIPIDLINNARAWLDARLNNQLLDDDPRLKSLCKVGEGKQCCRWLARGPRGYFCAKFDPAIADAIRERAEAGQLGALGDNCPGLTP
jgi:hypothetical protein